ncbi:MAG: oligopeptide/dipeptide ABC transporter ATP-binding protein [Clostridium sp.]|uniref:oligopeptide/dipeptide ABC transporter ATP-binding protein n=1 Tax=Clostridium sp. TaxID=1506 RepID=UPI003EE78A6A
MYLGEIVEEGLTKEIYENPKHPYTKALMKSIPISDPRLRGKKKAKFLVFFSKIRKGRSYS